MPPGSLIITYHVLEAGPLPLCVAPELFREHLDALAAAGVHAVTVAELAAAVRHGEPLEGRIALTFDDGFASVVELGAPLLAERGWPATVFAVAGHVGGFNDWPSQPFRAPRRPLATAAQLRELAELGWEIGSHGLAHEPLARLEDRRLKAEVADSRARLEDQLGVQVSSFAYPYGSVPAPPALAHVRGVYDSACGSRCSRISAAVDPHLLPRVDAHYLRSPGLLAHVVRGRLDGYLAARRTGARVRRAVWPDHALAA